MPVNLTIRLLDQGQILMLLSVKRKKVKPLRNNVYSHFCKTARAADRCVNFDLQLSFKNKKQVLLYGRLKHKERQPSNSSEFDIWAKLLICLI